MQQDRSPSECYQGDMSYKLDNVSQHKVTLQKIRVLAAVSMLHWPASKLTTWGLFNWYSSRENSLITVVILNDVILSTKVTLNHLNPGNLSWRYRIVFHYAYSTRTEIAIFCLNLHRSLFLNVLLTGLANTDLGNGLVPWANNPLPESIMWKTHDSIWHHWASANCFYYHYHY